ncbi:hypothetical protein M8J77_022601 [Diaphorina citri]|nr:hypothetical protein M8J77_022601 [Diaphorina citri]
MPSSRIVVLMFGVCLVFVSLSMAESENDFEEDDEDEEFQRPPVAAAPVRNKKGRPLHESARGPTAQGDAKRLNCPLCDSSVYSYCSDKLLHDACCCLSDSDADDLPPQCNYADCSFLHANTCREHRLITACCCNQRL